MHFPLLPLLLLALSPLLLASTIEDVTQASYRLASYTDQKQYDRLGSVMTRDVRIDATELRPQLGGQLNGLDDVKNRFRQTGAGARTEHQITNSYLRKESGPRGRPVNRAEISKYITQTHWVENALNDRSKTWRIHYRCDDVWVLEDGTWKMQYSKLHNLAFKAENPYYR